MLLIIATASIININSNKIVSWAYRYVRTTIKRYLLEETKGSTVLLSKPTLNLQFANQYKVYAANDSSYFSLEEGLSPG